MSSEGFGFKVVGNVGRVRAGEFVTPHGVIKTPIFMPVGTLGVVKSLTPDDLSECGAGVVLANTYHLYLRPGDKLVKKMGGLHGFMTWSGPILTDSGGFQVSSLGLFEKAGKRSGSVRATEIDEEGVTFWSHLDGSKHRLNAEKSIDIQHSLGGDIIMAFDEATPGQGKVYARAAMERTHNWLVRSKARWEKLESGSDSPSQALFGIVQGDGYRDLRRESARFVVSQNLPGIAVGGGSVGASRQATEENVDWIYDILPKDIPLYLMGVGVGPRDLISAILAGADMFDCVAPTRLARSGILYSGKMRYRKTNKLEIEFDSGFANDRISIGSASFARDPAPIDSGCDCYTCRCGFSRAYLHHLFKRRELTYYRLGSIHNVRFMLRLCEQIREVVLDRKS